MDSTRDSAALPALGFPIRESTGHRPFNASPWLIAVVHALHRLLVPRHPPYALIILTVISLLRRKRARGAGDTQLYYFQPTVRFSRTGERRPGSRPPRPHGGASDRVVPQSSTVRVRAGAPREGSVGARSVRARSTFLGPPAAPSPRDAAPGGRAGSVRSSLERR